MNSIASKIATLKRLASTIRESTKSFDEIKINQGVILAQFNLHKRSTNIQDYEFKVFSQWGEDGILQYLTSVIEIPQKTFIEFGVEDFSESSCRFLLMKDNWRGFVLDGSSEKIERLKGSYYYWRHDLSAKAAFITQENVNGLLAQSGFDEELGILSIDIDGNDYHVCKAITGFRPRILVCEYNAVFGAKRLISVPYDPDFVRTARHNSNLFYGASLAALVLLAGKKGYSLVGTNSAGNNAFFVRNDLVNDKLKVLDAATGFTPSWFRESRDPDGNLTYVGGEARVRLLQGLQVLNVETDAIEDL